MDIVIKNFQNITYGPAPEDSKEVNSWIKNLKNPNNHFINGKFVKSSSLKNLNVIKRSTNKKISTSRHHYKWYEHYKERCLKIDLQILFLPNDLHLKLYQRR